MKGSLIRRGPKRWAIVLDLPRVKDPVTGSAKRKQKWIKFHGTKVQADKKLAELVNAVGKGEFVEPSALTLGGWLTDWREKAIKPPRKAQSTYDGYGRIIETSIGPALGHLRLQALTPLDLDSYYASLTRLAPTTIQVHHAILHSALKAAALAGLVTRNVATLVPHKPQKRVTHDVLDHVWTADEAARFLATAKAAGPQTAALYAVLLDTGCRKGELAGLRWSDVDLDSRRLTIQRTLLKSGREPVFGPTKTKVARTIELAAETVALLRTHKAQQAAIKLRNRQHYHDLGLVFAKEWGDLHNRPDALGWPLQANTLAERQFNRLCTEANVRRIKIHGLRHTVATLLLSAGVPAHVVQRRLGHSKVEMTLNIYAHALPSMQQDAAERLARLLHG